jgi:predicted ribonuclease YlaK
MLNIGNGRKREVGVLHDDDCLSTGKWNPREATRALEELLEPRKFDDTYEPLPLEESTLKVDLSEDQLHQQRTRNHDSFENAMDDLFSRLD